MRCVDENYNLVTMKTPGREAIGLFQKTTLCVWAIILSILFVSESYAHGTQTAYCITNSGKIRVWIEHWHGNISPGNVTNALVSINVTDNSTGLTTNFQSIPDGVVWDTTIGNLPDCKGSMNVLSTCPGRSNVYNDWVYWDFVPPSCFVSLTIEIVEVIGSQSWYFDEACTALYPVNFTDSFIDCVPPQITCPTDQIVEVNATGCGANVTGGFEPTILFDDCTPTPDIILAYTVTGATTASGNGPANIFFNKGVSVVTYSATDAVPSTSTCSFTVTVEDNNGPSLTCPNTLNIECNQSGKGAIIADWLNQVSATDLCGVSMISNNYDPDGFAGVDQSAKFNSYGNNSALTLYGNMAFANVDKSLFYKSMLECSESLEFSIQEMSGSNLFDYLVKLRVEKNKIELEDYNNILFLDSKDRIIPFWIESQNEESIDFWLKIPEILASEKSKFFLKYGNCQGIQFNYDNLFNDEITPATASLAQAKPVVIGYGISNLPFLNDAVQNDDEGTIANKMMDCNCTASQGSQSFAINAIQNAEDDVSFYQYGTPNGASANTGLEMNDAVVLFLYENILTGEISLFILIDAAGGGNGGKGSIDFYCLPASATLDFSDDPGEISGIFPTVTANWGWANCCTDGALIGNVGCNSTFDFYPSFSSGISSMKWVSGSLASPVFTNFNNFSDPVRIQCGSSNPVCCPNANTVNVTDATCPGDNDGSIDLIVDPNGAPYTYAWSTGATTQDVNGLSNGTYTVTVTDTNDCEQEIPVEVGVQNTPSLTCAANQTVMTDSDMVSLVAGDNVIYGVDYNCTNDYTVTCSGCGTYNCDDQGEPISITLTVTDELGNTDQCNIQVTIQNNPPQLTCPDDLDLECNQSGKDAVISDWLSTASSSSPDLNNISNDYNLDGFVFMDDIFETSDIVYHSSGKQSIQTSPRDEYYNLSSFAFADSSPTGSQTVTFIATDNCGNTSTCTATINIIDTTDPVINCPSDLTIECGNPNNDAIITNWLDNVTANDACDLNPIITNNYAASFAGGCDGPTGSRLVRFTATDCDGNSSTCTATITVVDTTPPEFLMKPQDLTVGCINTEGNTPELTAWLAANGGGMAVDDCDPTVTWTRTAGATVDLCGYTFSREYTFTITDNCGNTNTAVATFTVEDTTPPIMNAPVDRSINCNPGSNDASLAIYLASASASDACSLNSDIDISYVLNSHEDLCGGTFIETYIFTATDECGNTATDIFTFQVTDTTPPTWASPPPTLILECNDPDNPTLITEWIDAFEESITDLCDDDQNIIIENNWDGSLVEGCNRNTVIVWTVTDGCGNSRTLSRTIAVRDRINPTFINCPDDFTVNVDVDMCGSVVTFPTPVAYDQCTPQDELVITQINGPASGSTFPVGTTYVRFRVQDGCLRQDLCDFFITVVDSDTPAIACPSNVEACARPGLCFWTSDASVNPITNDNCAGLTIQFELSGATTLSRRNGTAWNRNFNVGTTQVCYWLTDSAGNETTCCFEVIVSDCEDPIISCPSDITNAVCGSTPPASFMATATDNCSSNGDIVISSSLYNTISGCGNSQTEVYLFIATDEAGNTSQCFANFQTIDLVAPVILTAASNGNSDCVSADVDFLAWLNDNGGAEASDACGELNWSYEFVGGAMTGCSGAPSANVVFTVTDECGNTSTTQATFEVDDNTNPTITCPSDITLECGDVLNQSVIELWLNSATGEDNCSDVEISNNFPEGTVLECDESITVIFTATDDCGNTATCSASISMEDTLPPTFTLLPQDITLECGAGDLAESITLNLKTVSGAAYSDQCTSNSDLTVDVVNLSDNAQCGNSSIQEYLVTITDECDNSVQASWFINIDDTIDPELTVPSNLTLECDGLGNQAAIDAWLATASATDDCGSASIERELYNSSNTCGSFENLTYLFTATDECGNESTGLADVIISDTTSPIISCPPNITLNCGDNNNSTLIVNWLDQVSATDNCSNLIFSNNYTGLLPSNCGGSIVVTFVATDDCGNTASCNSTIFMEDMISPDFENCPEDLTINVDVSNCGSNPIFSTPIAVDNCGVTVAQTAGPASGTEFPVGTTTVEFTATDECGNTTTCEFDITVVDSSDPLILCPSNLFDRCITDNSCSLIIEDIAPTLGLENCPGFTITYVVTGATTASGNNDASGTSFNLGTSTVCYTLTDAATNTSTCCFDIQVLDCAPPQISCPTDLIVACDGTGNSTDLTTWLASASANDACSSPITFTNKPYNTISGCGDTNTTVYEFVATDAAGNSAVCYASFMIEDVTNPVITEDAEDLTVECDGANNSNDIQSWLNNFGGTQASDGCGAVSYSHDFSGSLSDACAETGSITVIFTATDDCGNTATSSAVFTIEDTTAPVINCPNSISLECGDPANEAIITNWLATASASDDCSEVVFTNNFETSFTAACGDTGEYSVTFTATDDCGNSSTCEKQITIVDQTNPLFEASPMDLILECSNTNNSNLYNSWLDANGNGVASDNCGEITWSVSVLDAIPSCGQTESIPHLWTITDECGNFSTAISNVITNDNNSPEITAPDILVVECDGLGNTSQLDDWLESVTGSDDCGEVSLSYTLNNTISACGGSLVREYIFTASDACGNESTATSSFTIEDTAAPIITCPSDLELECGNIGNDQLINAWLLSTTWTDTCSDVEITHNYNGTLPADCNGSISITFTATDECGNTATCVSNILMDDTLDPIFINCPEDLTINVDVDECGSNPIFSTPVAEDNCQVSVTQTGGLASGTTFPVGTTTIEFTAEDACGNTAICQFDIIVIDSDVPQVFCPSTTVSQCVDFGQCTWTSDSSIAPTTSFENCDDYNISYTISGSTVSSGNNSATGEILNLGVSTVCYTIEDVSGNSSNCCFDVLVQDCEAPILICPNDLVVECANNNEVQKSNWLNSSVASDNCDLSPSITYELFNSVSACGGGETEYYLITATDLSGNISTCIRSFEVEDNIAPVINSTVADITVECDGNGNIDQLISWLDANGNIANSSVTEFCSDYAWYNNFDQVSFQNNPSCSDDIGFYEVQFWVIDECGNESNRITKRFNIEDSSDPILSVPADLTLQCGNPLNDAILASWLEDITATDLCDLNVSVDIATNVIDQCGETNTTLYTITATDHCGNQIQENRQIVIIDNEAPVVTIQASDLYLECADVSNDDLIDAWESAFGNAVATDNCSDEDLEWSIESQIEIESCGLTTTTSYVFEVEDNCGNVSTTTASVITQDTTNPELVLPENQLEECGNIEVSLTQWQNEATATDECGDVDIDVILWDTQSDCGGTLTEIYLFTATDDCGNSTTGLAHYELEDTASPTIACPSDLLLECGDDDNDQKILAWLNGAIAIDENNCSNVIISHDYPGGLPQPMVCNGGTGLVVTFTATDECGNTATCSAVIRMDDIEVPYFVNCPSNLIVNVDVDQCSTNVVYSTPVALDDCSNNLTINQIAGPLSGTAFPLGSSQITFEAIDACGNRTTCSFQITVIDTDVPSILCPTNDVVKCADSDACVWTPDTDVDPIYNDNCDGFSLLYTVSGATIANSSNTGVNIISEDGVIFNLGTSTVCYTILDDSGNNETCCFDVIVEDCESPQITCSDQIDVACGEEDLSSWFDAIAATATDNCDSNGDLVVDTLLLTDFSSCGNTFERVYLFTVTDLAGNSSTCTATYETDDNIAPLIVTEAQDLTLQCNGGELSITLQAWLNNVGGATASDACSLPLIWSNDFNGDLTGSCGSNGAVMVTFTVSDDCGNTSTTQAIFTIEDTVNPVIVCPEDLILECGNDLNDEIINAWLSQASSEDDCQGTLTVVNDFSMATQSDECGLTGVTTITFTATDACGNSSSCQRTITIIDNTSPQITTAPTDLILVCADDNNPDLIENWANVFGGSAATDDCSDEDLVWSILSTTEFESCGNTGSTLYVFVVEDNCGNTSTTSASVVIVDNDAPTLNLPLDQLEECGNVQVSLEEWRSEVTASDECGEVTTSSILWNSISACGSTYTLEYLFTATDACGNTSTGIATYSTEDTSNPTIACPADLILDCGNPNNDQRIAFWLESASATDAFGCNSIDITYTNPGSLPDIDCSSNAGITVTFTATDACGNEDQCTAMIIVEDNIDPTFVNCPDDLTINVDVDACSSNPIFSTPIAEDNCSVNVEQIANADGEILESGTAFPLGDTEVVFLATDICGNTAICSFVITVEDSDVPIVLCPSNTIEVSTDDGVCSWTSDSQVSTSFSVENCPDQTLEYTITGATVASGNDDAAGEVFNLGLSTVCYTLTDVALNQSMCCFDVFVIDEELPQMTCPDNVILETSDVIFGDCQSELDWVHPTVSDNCDLTDGTLELFVQAPNGTLTGPLTALPGAAVNMSFDLGLTNLTYVLTDANGNVTTCEWTITVEDNEIPEITCPEDLVFEINDDCQYTEITNDLDAITNDNCEVDFVIHDYIFAPSSNTLSGASFNVGNTTVVWTVFDESGNSNTCEFVITVEDNENPEFVNCPQDTVVVGTDVDECSAFVNWSDPIAQDECGVAVEQTLGPNSGDALAPGFYDINYVATDNNGNTSLCEFVIHVQDTQMPIVLCPSNDVVVETDIAECTWISPEGSLTATTALTNCPFVLTWSVTNPDASVTEGSEDVSGYTFGLGTSIVCYDVIEESDPDGNGLMSDQCCFNVIVEDNEKPQVVCPEDASINTSAGGTGDCLANFAWNHPSPEDNCGIAMIFLTINEANGNVVGPIDVVAGNNMIHDFQIGISTVVYDVEDSNGNTSSCLFSIEVSDDENPEVTCADDVTEVADDNCQFVVTDDTLDPVYSDNCGVEFSYHDYIFAPNSSTLAGAKFDFGITEINWTIVDEAGNQSSCSHTVTVIDQSAPVITNCPANTITQDSDGGACEAIVNFSNISAEDNCGGYIELEYMLSGAIAQDWAVGQASGLSYPIGITTVSYRATDQYGNVSDLCEFDIDVVDNMAPTAVCQDIEIGVDFNCMASIVPEDIDFGSTDNCGIASLLISENGTDFYSELEFMTEDLSDPFVVVTLQVTDVYGNTAICQSTVFIVDEIDPMVICQDDIIVSTEPGVCYAMVPNVIPPIDTTDNCMGISNVRQEPLPGLLFGSEVGDSMFVTVIVEDEAGNADSCQVKLIIEDTELPQFTNCPRPPVVVAAETDLCSAAANFSVPTGTDNCGAVEITRIDEHDLDSGDWFPIGTTILQYQIEDESGNKDTCHIKVIVNDLQPPSFACPDDVVQVNDPGFCGAVVKDISPEEIMDNCTDELTVTFAVDLEGERDNGGVIDASGEYFQVGNNLVTYCLEDRPSLLISEVTHEIGADIGTNTIPSYFDQGLEEDYIEITNVGPSTVDVSCLVIEKLVGSSGGIGSFTVPFNTLMAPGDVLVLHLGSGVDSPADLYFNEDIGGANSGDPAGYAIMFGECVIDVVALNGFNPIGSGDLVVIDGNDWSGAIDNDTGTAGVYRPFSFDGNNSNDWEVVDEDHPGSIGKVNQDFDVYPDTGLTSTLQSKCGTKVCCSFTVEIFDVEPPTIECPDDISINTSDNGLGDCLSSTSWKHPDIDDNCATSIYCMTIVEPDGTEEENCSIAPGVTFIDEFEVGETTIIYEVEDEAGNKTTCSFVITVVDDEDPLFTCPGDLFVQLEQGQCFADIFSEINLFETDNCGEMVILSTPDMDGQFNPGENEVTIVITDEAGNERACSFMITVEAYNPASTEMACQGTVNVSLNGDCEALITADMILTTMDIGCIDDIELSISETHGGDPIPGSPLVTSQYLNQSLIVTLFNPDTGNSCWGTIYIEDKLNPVIECPDDMIVSCAEGVDPANIGMPVVTSCEESVTMVFADEIIDNGLCGVPRAIHTRTWIVTDESGNTSTCSHTITVERLEASAITYPQNYDDVDNPSFDCDAVADDPLLIHPNNTGRPTINGSDVLDAEYCPLSINVIDEIFDLCDGSYDILRTWRVYDPCKPVDKTGPDPNPVHSIQVIKVRDMTAPVVSCPGDMTVSVGASCVAEIDFPAATIEEACGSSDIQIITPFGSLNTNGGVIGNIAVGTFTVRYVATDGCGNQSECSMEVTVVDEVQPVVVCNPDVVVSLNDTGVAEVYGEVFDAGTSDNCTLDRIEVRRMDTPCGIDADLEFGETVTFCCADVGNVVLVQMRAYDAVGNFNDCMIEVEVDDKQDAEITCPADIVVDCGSTDYKDITLTGMATFTDNCSGNLSIPDHSDEEFIDQCGNGYVLRTWSVGTVSCVQRIDLVDPEPFYISDTDCANVDPNDGIIWPCDVEIESCSDMQDPSVTGEVQVFDDNCSLTGIDYEDQVFTFEDGACFKILRTWKIIDWCTYDANTLEGYWEYDQVIKIINSLPPTITSCDDLDVCIYSDACEIEVTATGTATDDCTDPDDLGYSYQLDIGNDGIYNINGNGSTLTHVLPIGSHSILWSVQDGCGNVETCTQQVNVNDCKAPTAYCINGLSISLESGTGTVSIWANDFDNGSTDNCTDQNDLHVSFSSDVTDTSVTFSCSDLPNGQEEYIPIQMWVTDAYGNQSFCTTNILVQDVHDACPDVVMLFAEIAGRVVTEDDLGVNEVEIQMENMDSGEDYDMMSDTLGTYHFPDPMPTDIAYELIPTKNDDHTNGLSAMDLLAIQKHLLEVELLDSPYKLIAADVNSSEKVSSVDLIQLQKLLLGVYNEFPDNSSWRFVRQGYVFPDPTDPWPFEEYRSINPLEHNEMEENFIGVKIGDVNGSVDPINLNDTQLTKRNELKLNALDMELEAGQTYSLPLLLNGDLDLNALQFTLQSIDPNLEILDIGSGKIEIENSDYIIREERGLTTLVWYNIESAKLKEADELIWIEVKANDNLKLSNSLIINSEITQALAVANQTEETKVSLNWIEQSNTFAVSQNMPNPFVDKTSFEVFIPTKSDFEIKVFDVLGQQVYNLASEGQGLMRFSLTAGDLGNAAGMYSLEVNYRDQSVNRNIILIK